MQKPRILRSLLSGFILLSSTTLFAAEQPDLPTRSSLDNKLTSLNKRDTLTVAEKAQKEDIEQTIALLDSIEKEKIKAKDQDQSLTRTPAKLKEYTRQLELLQKNDAQDTEALKNEISRLSQTQLDSRLTDLLSQLQSAQSDLGNANSQLTFLQTLPERAQSAMSQDYQRMQDIRNRLSGLKQSGEITPSLRVKLNTELALLQLQQEQRQKDLDNNTSQQDLYNKQRDYLAAQIAQLNNWVQLLQQQVSNKRLTLTEKTVEESGTNQTDGAQTLPSFIQKELRLNQQLSQQLIDATQGVNSLVQENIKVKNWLDRTTQTEQNLNEQISVLKGSLLLSKILYQQNQMLPDSELVQNSEEQIADLRLAYINKDYSAVVSEVKDTDSKSFSQEDKYILAYSVIMTEPLTDEQRTELSSISTQSNADYLRYWILIGQAKIDDAIDIASYLDDPQLLMYGMTKKIDEIQRNPELSSEERTTQLESYKTKLEELKKQYRLSMSYRCKMLSLQ